MPITHTTRSLSTEAARAGRRWFIADAEGQVLGRLATRIATVLRGKHTPAFSPHIDAGDFVIVVNAQGHPAHGPEAERQDVRPPLGLPRRHPPSQRAGAPRERPTRVLREAVEGMLPKNRLGRRLATKLKVYAGPDHPHRAQKPLPLV